jgi:ABC-type multidrug transport system ATPase subunit
LNLEENLLFFSSLYGAVDAEHSRSLLEKFGLYTRRKDPVSTYSQGMIKRANLIRSLLHHPELWILDEPFGGLDQEGQALLKEFIRDYASRGRTVLLVTHNREIGEELASASIEIQNGFIVDEAGLDGGGVT